MVHRRALQELRTCPAFSLRCHFAMKALKLREPFH
jgi:hypothetical protein